MRLKTNKKITILILQILAWSVLVMLPGIFIAAPASPAQFGSVLLSMLLLITMFYVNYYILIPELLTKRKFFAYGLIIFAIVVFSMFTALATDLLSHSPAGTKIPHGLGIILLSILSLAVSTSIKITLDWFGNEKLRKEMENQKLSAELSFLKAQINPHFFFNTLNSIYSLAIQKSDKTPEAIVKLSELMRYIIYESEKELVPLKRELEYIKNLVELQRLRLMANVKVTYTVEGNSNGRMIEPLILLPFIENAFKHGVDYTKDCEIKIGVSIKTDQLLFLVENPNIFQNSKKLEGGSGIGLANSVKRLDLLYPHSYNLTITPTEHLYKIELMLKLRNNELPYSR